MPLMKQQPPAAKDSCSIQDMEELKNGCMGAQTHGIKVQDKST